MHNPYLPTTPEPTRLTAIDSAPYRPTTDPATWIFDAIQEARAMDYSDQSCRVADAVLHAVWVSAWRAAAMYSYKALDKDTLVVLYAQSPGYADFGAGWAELIVGLMSTPDASLPCSTGHSRR